MLSNRRRAHGRGTPTCKGDVQGKILHYKLCGRGLTANPRLQFCGGHGSLASIHELTRTENFQIRTPPLSIAGLVVFTKVVKTGGFFKFTALPLQDQTMHANESCHFCSSCALVFKLQRTLEYLVLSTKYRWLSMASGAYPTLLISSIASHERYIVFKLKP